MKNTRAFTLLELLLGVLIVSILAAVSTVGVQMYQDRAAMTTDEANQQVLYAAVKLFAYDTGRLPNSLTEIPALYYNSDLRSITCPTDRTPPLGGISYELSPGAGGPRGQPLSWLLNPANAGADLIGEADDPGGYVLRHQRGTRCVVTTVNGTSRRFPP